MLLRIIEKLSAIKELYSPTHNKISTIGSSKELSTDHWARQLSRMEEASLEHIRQLGAQIQDIDDLISLAVGELRSVENHPVYLIDTLQTSGLLGKILKDGHFIQEMNKLLAQGYEACQFFLLMRQRLAETIENRLMSTVVVQTNLSYELDSAKKDLAFALSQSLLHPGNALLARSIKDTSQISQQMIAKLLAHARKAQKLNKTKQSLERHYRILQEFKEKLVEQRHYFYSANKVIAMTKTKQNPLAQRFKTREYIASLEKSRQTIERIISESIAELNSSDQGLAQHSVLREDSVDC